MFYCHKRTCQTWNVLIFKMSYYYWQIDIDLVVFLFIWLDKLFLNDS